MKTYIFLSLRFFLGYFGIIAGSYMSIILKKLFNIQEETNFFLSLITCFLTIFISDFIIDYMEDEYEEKSTKL